MRSMLNVALPKGRLGEKVYAMFEKAGFPCPSILENNRKLIFENEELGLRFFWAKPSDVPIYVERGVADIGVAGKDILLEYAPDVYELRQMPYGCGGTGGFQRRSCKDPAGGHQVFPHCKELLRGYGAGDRHHPPDRQH